MSFVATFVVDFDFLNKFLCFSPCELEKKNLGLVDSIRSAIAQPNLTSPPQGCLQVHINISYILLVHSY